ncbi:hypothetical protein BDW42DRAFT_18857 [Aspergillus taichungensis]|uniref:Uncharacterized protein n=1 Tax=Aspergillus taichungensis TaxID=482145 RepID=A0A2J5I5L1_9EURO|nr:hypothetical protein BDW42DRAFT_18857 [Aspergillus taichungensis]
MDRVLRSRTDPSIVISVLIDFISCSSIDLVEVNPPPAPRTSTEDWRGSVDWPRCLAALLPPPFSLSLSLSFSSSHLLHPSLSHPVFIPRSIPIHRSLVFSVRTVGVYLSTVYPVAFGSRQPRLHGSRFPQVRSIDPVDRGRIPTDQNSDCAAPAPAMRR